MTLEQMAANHRHACVAAHDLAEDLAFGGAVLPDSSHEFAQSFEGGVAAQLRRDCIRDHARALLDYGLWTDEQIKASCIVLRASLT